MVVRPERTKQLFAREPLIISCDADLDARLEDVHTGPAVFAIHSDQGAPYLARTAALRRRLKRLTKRSVRELARLIEYWPVASRLESSLVLYELARTHLPDRYLEWLKIRMPPYVRVSAGGGFPRTQVTTKLSSSADFYGPFRSRAAAEQFERELLDLFQVRRCQEDLVPSPEHPGCIYGEMSMCLRPCQALVSVEEYASEAERLRTFLRTSGREALIATEKARDRLSAEMEFEAAAQQHKRAERIHAVLKLRDDLARPVSALNGVAVLPCTIPGFVLLETMIAGTWQKPVEFPVAGDFAESMDARLRVTLAAIHPEPARERDEHIAILARWYYSSWRDGAWIEWESREKLPYRRLVSAISRTVHQTAPTASH